MVDEVQKEQTLGSENIEAVKEDTASQATPKTFTEDDLNRIVKDRLDRERKKYSDYNDLKAAKSKLDEIEKSKLSDEEKAKAKLAELEARIAEKEQALKDRSLKDLIRDKIETAVAEGRMKLPKGKTVASLVNRAKATREEDIDLDVEDLVGYFPPDEPSKSIGTGTQQPAARPVDVKDQIANLTQRASDPKLNAIERSRIQDQLIALKMKAGGFSIV